jgi:hypothetical protein
MVGDEKIEMIHPHLVLDGLMNIMIGLLTSMQPQTTVIKNRLN